MKNPQIIVITGASSGLGAALSRYYADTGVTLHLHGRHSGRLEEVAEDCRKYHATVHTRVLDVTDRIGMEKWLLEINAQSPVDLVIANAGISAGTGEDGESDEQVRRIFATNIDGVLNTIQPLIPSMSTRGKGQIAIISSLAGIRGLPSCPAYSASKASIRYYGEGLRGWLRSSGVHVNIVCPGYIKTPMTDVNDFTMPFIMSADKAAKIIARGLSKNRGRIAFPWPLYIPLWFLSCLSPIITDPLFSNLPAKPAAPAE